MGDRLMLIRRPGSCQIGNPASKYLLRRKGNDRLTQAVRYCYSVDLAEPSLLFRN